jgi:RNA polymerase sigma-70 factor (ECF subfamily)
VHPDPSILQRIAAGDASAVAECMDRYGGLVWSLVRSRLRNAADAEDATQEIFIDIWSSAARFDPAIASEAVFIGMIARRRLIDRLRAKGRQPATEELDETLLVEHAEPARGQHVADAQIAARAVATLGDSQREILLMGVVQGLTHSEIATATGLPLGTVKTHMRRGLAKVRALLDAGGAATPAEVDE